MLPSPRFLYKKKREGIIKQGFNPKTYSRFHDEFVSSKYEIIVGNVMMDEMKLKSGVYFNSNGNSVSGFSTEGNGITVEDEF